MEAEQKRIQDQAAALQSQAHKMRKTVREFRKRKAEDEMGNDNKIMKTGDKKDEDNKDSGKNGNGKGRGKNTNRGGKGRGGPRGQGRGDRGDRRDPPGSGGLGGIHLHIDLGQYFRK